jgi:hypothetical protein
VARDRPTSPKNLTDLAIAERILAIFVNASQGSRSLSDDRQYGDFRKELLKRELPVEPPRWVLAHPSVNSFCAYIKGTGDRGQQLQTIREMFTPFLGGLKDGPASGSDSSSWTGLEAPAVRVKLIKRLLPLADTAVDSLIATLSQPNPNGGPLLDSRVEAIEHLRALHLAIGKLLAAVDAGHLNDGLGQGLAADAFRFAKKAARALRDDPVPYVASALILGMFEACGIGSLGGYLVGVAQNIRERTPAP